MARDQCRRCATEPKNCTRKPFQRASGAFADLTLRPASGRETDRPERVRRSQKDVIYHHLSRQRNLRDGIAATLRRPSGGVEKKDSRTGKTGTIKKILSSPTNWGVPSRAAAPTAAAVSRKPAERDVAARRERLVRSSRRRADSNDRPGISRDDQRFGSRPWRLEDVNPLSFDIEMKGGIVQRRAFQA